jgi:hypothetical protein
MHHDASWDAPQHLLSNHMQSKSMGAAKPLFCKNIMEACEAREYGSDSKRKHQVEGAIMQEKEWTRTFGRCNPMEHAVTKQQRSMSALEKNRASIGKSPIQLLVHVLEFVVRNHLRLSHPPRLFYATNHILNPLKVHTPK